MSLEISKNLEQIKASDPELREGAYLRFLELFSDEENQLTIEKKHLILEELCSDNYLFYGIEEGISDCTVGRSFSLLILSLLVAYDKKNELEVERIVTPLLKYIDRESDFRGKDDRLGWVHSLAHLGDLLSFMAEHDRISKETIELISVKVILKIISLQDFLLNYGEDKRLAIGLFYALEKCGNNKAIMETLLRGVKLDYPFKKNSENIVRCLYIQLMTESENKNLVDAIKGLL